MSKQNPKFTDETPIGLDIDLEREDIRLADRTCLTEKEAADITERVLGSCWPSFAIRYPTALSADCISRAASGLQSGDRYSGSRGKEPF